MPISATSPEARIRANGMGGVCRLANTIDNRSGARATSSRAMIRTSGDSSTRWKSSRIRTAPCSAIVGSSRRKTSIAASRVGPPVARSLQHRAVVGANAGIVLAPGGHEVAQEGDPVAVLVVEPIPQRPQPGPLREIGEQRRLPVARVGQDQDDAMVDLGAPANRAGGPARASRPATAGAGPSRAGSGTRSSRSPAAPCTNGSAGLPRADGDRSPRAGRWDVPRADWGRERYGLAESRVSTVASGPGICAHLGRRRSSAD